MNAVLSIRTDPDNPDHHLWRNHGTWWCHLTVHLPGHRAKRVRRSLRTSDVERARRRRDRIIARLAGGER